MAISDPRRGIGETVLFRLAFDRPLTIDAQTCLGSRLSPKFDGAMHRAGCPSGLRGMTDEKHGPELRWRDHSLSRAARVSGHRSCDSICPERCRAVPWSGPGYA